MNIRIEEKSFYGLHCPIYTVLPWKFQSSIFKIDKVIAANMGQEERKKERKNNFYNNNRTPQTEFGGVLNILNGNIMELLY